MVKEKTINEVVKEMLDNMKTKKRGEDTIYVTKETI
mgnify:CR=1 FL=1